MTMFTKEISKESFERMLDNVGDTLVDINKNYRLLCPHVKAIRERKGEIVDFESIAEIDNGNKNVTRTFYFDNQKVDLRGNVYRCNNCGERFFVPVESLSGKTETERFMKFAQTFLNTAMLFRDLVAGEVTLRGLYDKPMDLTLPGNIRSRVGHEFLLDLAGRRISTRGGVARTDRTLQLDRAVFLAQLDAIIEIYQNIVDFYKGEEVVMDDVEIGSFETAVDDDSFTPSDRSVPHNRVERERSAYRVDMISRRRDDEDDGGSRRGTRASSSSSSKKKAKAKKDV